MTRGVTTLKWRDVTIPHVLTVQRWRGGVRLKLQIVKDGATQPLLPIDLPKTLEEVTGAWTGEFTPAAIAVSSTHLYVQGRILLQLKDGCIYWSCNHWVAPDMKKHSIDCWGFMPGMCIGDGGLLAPIAT